MFSKMRYAIVLIAAAMILTVAVQIIGVRPEEQLNEQNSAEMLAVSVSEINEAEQGNPMQTNGSEFEVKPVSMETETPAGQSSENSTSEEVLLFGSVQVQENSSEEVTSSEMTSEEETGISEEETSEEAEETDESSDNETEDPETEEDVTETTETETAESETAESDTDREPEEESDSTETENESEEAGESDESSEAETVSDETEERTDESDEEEHSTEVTEEETDLSDEEDSEADPEETEVSDEELSDQDMSETETSDSEETESSEDSEEENSDTSDTETEETAQYGLSRYFEDKLIIDTEKVELYLNVREEPDNEAEILSILYPNEAVTYLRKVGRWYEIQCDGYTGYINGDYVLVGEAAYLARRSSVAYGAVIENNDTILYRDPDDSDPGIQLAHKGEVYRVVGISGDFYRISVYSAEFEQLYVRKADVFLYYLFLAPGSNNELTEEEEEILSELDLEGNLERAYRVQIEAQNEEDESRSIASSWEEYLASSRAEEWVPESVTPWTPETWAPEPTQPWVPETIETWIPESTEAWTPEPTQPETASSDMGGMTYVGSFRITHYCHCPLCCGAYGSWDENYEAYGSSGMRLQDNYTVAVDPAQIPLGTRLMINGREYIAADSGVGINCLDIYHRTHADALAGGMSYADVYIIH